MSVSEPSVTFCLSPGDKHYCILGGGQTYGNERVGQTFFVGGGGSYDDDVREAYIFVRVGP